MKNIKNTQKWPPRQKCQKGEKSKKPKKGVSERALI